MAEIKYRFRFMDVTETNEEGVLRGVELIINDPNDNPVVTLSREGDNIKERIYSISGEGAIVRTRTHGRASPNYSQFNQQLSEAEEYRANPINLVEN